MNEPLQRKPQETDEQWLDRLEYEHRMKEHDRK